MMLFLNLIFLSLYLISDARASDNHNNNVTSSTSTPLRYNYKTKREAFELFKTIVPKDYSLGEPIKDVIPAIRGASEKAVKECYSDFFLETKIDLFNRRTTLFDVLYGFYVCLVINPSV